MGDVGDAARGPVDMKSGWIPSVANKREDFQELASHLTKGDLTGLSQSRQLAINCGRKLYIHVWEYWRFQLVLQVGRGELKEEGTKGEGRPQ